MTAAEVTKQGLWQNIQKPVSLHKLCDCLCHLPEIAASQGATALTDSMQRLELHSHNKHLRMPSAYTTSRPSSFPPWSAATSAMLYDDDRSERSSPFTGSRRRSVISFSIEDDSGGATRDSGINEPTLNDTKDNISSSSSSWPIARSRRLVFEFEDDERKIVVASSDEGNDVTVSFNRHSDSELPTVINLTDYLSPQERQQRRRSSMTDQALGQRRSRSPTNKRLSLGQIPRHESLQSLLDFKQEFDLRRSSEKGRERVYVLVVDDSALLRRSIQHMLNRRGFGNVDTASSGTLALEMAQAFKYDVILSV
jgi:hypothetical protein